MNQKLKIITKLGDGLWHCSNELAGLIMVDYRSTINKMNKQLREGGMEIISTPCDLHKHKHRMNMWRLIRTPITQTMSGSGCCYSFLRFGIHSHDCIQHPERKTVSLFK